MLKNVIITTFVHLHEKVLNHTDVSVRIDNNTLTFFSKSYEK